MIKHFVFFDSFTLLNFWKDCKAIPVYGLMFSVRLSVGRHHFCNLCVYVLELALLSGLTVLSGYLLELFQGFRYKDKRKRSVSVLRQKPQLQ